MDFTKRGPWQLFLSYLKPHWKLIGFGLLAMIVSVVLSMIFPWVVKDIFDTIIREAQLTGLINLISALTAVFLLQGIASFFRNYLFSRVGESIILDLRNSIYEKLQYLSLSFFEDNTSGELVSRMTNDLNLIQTTITQGIAGLLRQILVLLAGSVILFYLDFKLALTILITMPLIVVTGERLGQKIKNISRKVQRKLGFVTSFLEQTISGISIIKSFVIENYVIGEFKKHVTVVFDRSVEGIKVKSALSAVIGFLNSLSILIVMGYGGYRVIQGAMSAGELIAFILYVEAITGPVAMLTGVYAEAQRTLAAGERICEILSAEQDIKENDVLLDFDKKKHAGLLEFKNVSFSYDSDKKVLHDINFKIKPGEVVALVGPSGAGKSTIAKLIPRFYDVDCGSILIDDIDIRKAAVKELRKMIGIVPQEAFLFAISIRDNIACGKIEADEEDIKKAACEANAMQFIEQLSEGFETQVGEHGVKLSGGQKQRISIARTMLKAPQILILDEATSSLDSITEQQVQKALSRLMEKRTTLIIAHRLSTVINADRILVIDQGSIVEQGTHQQLLAADGLYTRLYRQQLAVS